MLILPFLSPTATLENAGGKGASLARLTRLGLPVPPGFIITTEAYRRFVAANNLADVIRDSIKGLTASGAEQLALASAQIRRAFSAGRLSEEIAQAVSTGYLTLRKQIAGDGKNGTPEDGSETVSLAVRSSATTEDLPELSFAGQQDTFLNVVGEEQLFKALVNCWSSLWTARAIGYRLRNAVQPEDAELAVIVQEMVPGEISGILFTANPLTGLQSESVIDATFGLGEGLVSGQVEPDHFVVDSFSAAIHSVTLGAKATSTRSKTGGGVESIREQAANRQTLTEEQVRQLVAAGQHIQKEYAAPQDIEWAFAGGKLFVLQARPITSLFPIPRLSFDPLIVWFSFSAFQGLTGPMTPLGQEAVQRVILGIGQKIGVKIKLEDQDLIAVAGERIWVKTSDLIRNPLGNRLFGGLLGIGEPGTALILRQMITDPRLGAGQGRLKLGTLRRVLIFLRPALLELPRSIIRPEKARHRFDSRLEAYLQTVQIAGGADRFERLANFAAFMSAQGGLADALATLLPRFMPIMAPSLAALNLMERLQPPKKGIGKGISMSVMEVTRGLPRNVTIEMDLALWDAAKVIQADPASAKDFGSIEASGLAARYLGGVLPTAAQKAVGSFMERYGMRGVGEIDLGQPRWREDPTPVMNTLQSYLQIQPEHAPDVLYEQGARVAEQAVQRLAGEARRQHGGWVKEKLVRAAARRVRLLLGARESPKFFAVRAMGRVRNVLLEIGKEFAAVGTIASPDDLFFLHVVELEALSQRQARDWKTLVAGRRLAYARELRRRQVPRLLVSDGRSFYEGVGASTDTGDTLTGSPVSPGVVEGIVHVVFDPGAARLVPGEILVCTGTDPAWTPLFMVAAGLVMEVGGMLTHGSVVAREYGIPAVVGVHHATLRLKDGQRIRVDGSTGTIAVL